jgi:hypothetical protein
MKGGDVMRGWLCCFVLALAGCAGAGTLVTPRDVAYFVPHQTTSSEIRALLGEPTHFETERDGSAQMVYDWTRTTLQPQDVIPVVGILFGAADTSRIKTIIYIGRDGTYDGVGRQTDQIPSGQFLATP